MMSDLITSLAVPFLTSFGIMMVCRCVPDWEEDWFRAIAPNMALAIGYVVGHFTVAPLVIPARIAILAIRSPGSSCWLCFGRSLPFGHSYSPGLVGLGSVW